MTEAQVGREEVRECAELGARKGTSSAEEGPGQTDCRGQNWKQETRTWKLQYNTIQYNTRPTGDADYSGRRAGREKQCDYRYIWKKIYPKGYLDVGCKKELRITPMSWDKVT